MPWIKLIPQFKALFDTNKAIAYDRQTYARKLLAFIYFYRDFSSPLRDWEDDKRKEESLKFVELTKADISTPKMKTAIEYYKMLQYESCRQLKTYEAVSKGLDAMDTYLNQVDFTKTDKQGKLLYTPNQYVANMALINKAYEERRKLAESINHDLTQTTGIRGKAVMGDSEMKSDSTHEPAWDENVITPDGKTQWTEIGGLMSKYKKEDD